MQSEEDGRRILLGNNTGSGTAMQSCCGRLRSCALDLKWIALHIHTYLAIRILSSDLRKIQLFW